MFDGVSIYLFIFLCVNREAEGRFTGLPVFCGDGTCAGGGGHGIGGAADLRWPPEPGGDSWSLRGWSHHRCEIRPVLHRSVFGFYCSLYSPQVSHWWTGKPTSIQTKEGE